jgi:hypothetical protein
MFLYSIGVLSDLLLDYFLQDIFLSVFDRTLSFQVIILNLLKILLLRSLKWDQAARPLASLFIKYHVLLLSDVSKHHGRTVFLLDGFHRETPIRGFPRLILCNSYLDSLPLAHTIRSARHRGGRHVVSGWWRRSRYANDRVGLSIGHILLSEPTFLECVADVDIATGGLRLGLKVVIYKLDHI